MILALPADKHKTIDTETRLPDSRLTLFNVFYIAKAVAIFKSAILFSRILKNCSYLERFILKIVSTISLFFNQFSIEMLNQILPFYISEEKISETINQLCEKHIISFKDNTYYELRSSSV